MTLYLDLETYSEMPLKNGTSVYASHPSTEIMLVAYALDDGAAAVWDATSSDPLPDDLIDALNNERTPVVIHNSFFDRTVMRATEFMDLPCTRIVDTMVQALSHGLPGALDKLSTVFGLSEDKAKMKDGRQLVHFFCKPNGGKRNHGLDHPEKWQRFKEYAVQDVVAMREIQRLLPTWNYPGAKFFDGQPSSEHRLWVLDQRINDRGFLADTALARTAVDAASAERKTLNQATQDATDGEVAAATQRDALLGYILREHGVSLPDMRQDTLKRRLDDPELPAEVKHLLDLRMQSSRNSSAKYTAVIKAVSEDGRLRGSLQFAGAATTNRWSGRVFQPQNMMRPTMKYSAIAQAIEDIKAGIAPLLHSNLPEVLGNVVRGIVVAPEGRKLVCADLKSIEGRMLAWLADDHRVTQFYRDVDAGVIDYDSYQLAYSLVFGVDPSTVTKPQRQIGKPIELAHGYGGGVAAFLTFAAVYYLDLDALAEAVWEQADPAAIRECEAKYDWAKENGYHAGMPRRKYAAFEYIKQQWRAAREPTVLFWQELANAFKHCVAYPRDVANVCNGRIKLRRDGQWLRIRLPSGRSITLLQPQVRDGQLSYMGLDRYTRQWKRVFTHGGKLAGIITQAAARDVLGANMQSIEDHGYDIVLTVHDEAITESPDAPEFNADHLSQIMSTVPPWATGLPLAADGFEAYRYRKDD